MTPRTVAFQAPLVYGILQARILKWVAIPFSRGSSWPRNQTQVSCIADRFFTPEPLGKIHAAKSAAKSLQSCPTLCDPMDCSLPGSPVPGILQARTLEWVAISSSNAWKWKVKVKLLSRVWLLATPWTAAYQAPPSMGFSRQEYWSGVPLYRISFFEKILDYRLVPNSKECLNIWLQIWHTHKMPSFTTSFYLKIWPVSLQRLVSHYQI